MLIQRKEAEIKLQRIFGINHFYDDQWEVIRRLITGERILMIQRTGFGKSLCYQFPAMLFSGLTVVFSPLIALMRDQVSMLQEKGIPAACINSEQTNEENEQIIERAQSNRLKILYIAPERQEDQRWIEAVRSMRLSMIVVDEAHVVSTWGHDFRPSYRKIIDLVRLLPSHMPVLAVTATATKKVQRDIEQQIGGKLTTYRGTLTRENFRLHVIKVKREDDKLLWLADNMHKLQGTGLIYTGTRVNAELYAKWLQYIHIKATEYHAGFDADTRKDIESGLKSNKWKLVVSTNALGMGMDKPDIRFVIHTQIPESPIHYYQEIGRAGRDGKPTEVILFYNEDKNNSDHIAQDMLLPKSFVENARPSQAKYQKVISMLQEEALTTRQIMRKGNMKETQARTICADLMDQKIIREVTFAKMKKYEYQYNAPELDFTHFEALKEQKMKDLSKMEEYVYTIKPRMEYLCRYLDCEEPIPQVNCDNTNLDSYEVNPNSAFKNVLEKFYELHYIPDLDMAEHTQGTITIDGIKTYLTIKIPYPNTVRVIRNSKLVGEYKDMIKRSDFTALEAHKLLEMIKAHKRDKSHIINGVAAAYYGVSNVGTIIHRCKYEGGGDFPETLLKSTLRAFKKKLGEIHFDLVVYVPPTHSGDLVKNFATKFASVIKVPISHQLKKIRITEEQKIFQNRLSKQDNVNGAFAINEDVKNKNIILIDDIYDSGETLKEIARILTAKGARYIAPVVIAKTVGGTL